MSSFAVILAAGGTGARFGNNKLLELLGGQTVLDRAINAFINRDDVSQLIVAGGSAYALPSHAKLSTTPPGKTRAHTVRIALNTVASLDAAHDVAFVAVHDAARPLVSKSLIDRVFRTCIEQGCAVPAVKLTSTIKRGASGSLPTPVATTLDRDELFAVQTPQCARRDWLVDACVRLSETELATMTDEAMMLENAGHQVMLVEGDEANLKITRPVDLALARLLLDDQSRETA